MKKKKKMCVLVAVAIAGSNSEQWRKKDLRQTTDSIIGYPFIYFLLFDLTPRLRFLECIHVFRKGAQCRCY